MKPGVAGYEGQALVEYVSMRTAAKLGLPVAKTEFHMFGAEPAIVIERYDRVRDGSCRVMRIHQEDFCQSLGVMPEVKYAEQGGPSTLLIVELLKKTGGRARDNVYRFVLYFSSITLSGRRTRMRRTTPSCCFPRERPISPRCMTWRPLRRIVRGGADISLDRL